MVIFLFLFSICFLSKSKRSGVKTLYWVTDGGENRKLTRYKHNLNKQKGFGWAINNGKLYTEMQVPYQNAATAEMHVGHATGGNINDHGIPGQSWIIYVNGTRIKKGAFNAPGYTGIGGEAVSESAVYTVHNSPENIIGSTFADEMLESDMDFEIVCVSSKARAVIPLCGRRKTFHDGSKSKNMALWFDAGGSRSEYVIPGPQIITSSYYGTEYPLYVSTINAILADPEHEDNIIFGDTKWDLSLPLEDYVEKMLPRDHIKENGYESNSSSPEYNGFGFPKYRTSDSSITRGPHGNMLTGWVARAAILKGGLNNPDAVPDLIVVGMSGQDGTGHVYGGLSLETEDMFYKESDQLEDIYLSYEAAGIPRHKIDVTIVSDHGMGQTSGGWRDYWGYTSSETNVLGDYVEDRSSFDSIEFGSWVYQGNEFIQEKYGIGPIMPYIKTTYKGLKYLSGDDFCGVGGCSIDRNLTVDGNGNFDLELFENIIDDLEYFFVQHPEINRVMTNKKYRSQVDLIDEARESYYPTRSRDMVFSVAPHTHRFDGQVIAPPSYNVGHGSMNRYDKNIYGIVVGEDLTREQIYRKVTASQLTATVAVRAGVRKPTNCKADVLEECVQGGNFY